MNSLTDEHRFAVYKELMDRAYETGSYCARIFLQSRILELETRDDNDRRMGRETRTN